MKQAIQEANEVSVPGPSGQTIAFFKLLFLAIPNIMTTALNQLVFVPRLQEADDYRWIRHRKVVYIPKVPKPSTPSDYRPLSMLEVLYKIPSRILALAEFFPQLSDPISMGLWLNAVFKNRPCWQHTLSKTWPTTASRCS